MWPLDQPNRMPGCQVTRFSAKRALKGRWVWKGLTISPKGELVMYKNKGQRLAFKTKGRTTLEEREVLDCSKKLRAELSKLKREMCFEKGTEMLIALSISSDQMLCHVHMFPETWFME